MYSTTGRRQIFDGDGTAAVRNTSFLIRNNADLVIYKRVKLTDVATLLVENTDYTIVIATPAPGAVAITPLAVIPSTEEWIAYRVQPRTQENDWVGGDDFSTATIEEQADNQAMVSDDQAETELRTMRSPITDDVVDMELPRVDVRKSMLGGYDSAGKPNAVDPVTITPDTLIATTIGQDIFEAANAAAVRSLISCLLNAGGMTQLQAGTISAIPTAASAGTGAIYIATDTREVLRSNGTAWEHLVIEQDTFANQPAGGNAGALFLATDRKELYRDDGSNFVSVNPPLRGHLVGGKLSRSAATTVGFQPTGATLYDGSGNRVYCEITSAWTKTFGAFATGNGNGGLGTGVITADTWYSVFMIGKADGTADYGIDTVANRASAAALLSAAGAGWDYFRRIGWVRSNGSSQLIDFIQTGDEFRWKDRGTNGIETGTGWGAAGDHSAGLTLTVAYAPVESLANMVIFATAHSTHGTLAFGTDETIIQPDGISSPTGAMTDIGYGSNVDAEKFHIRLDSSGQFVITGSTTDSGQVVHGVVRGWIDRRGQDDF